jgi:hypothetical protein
MRRLRSKGLQLPPPPGTFGGKEGADALSPGKHKVEFDFRYDGMGMGDE